MKKIESIFAVRIAKPMCLLLLLAILTGESAAAVVRSVAPQNVDRVAVGRVEANDTRSDKRSAPASVVDYHKLGLEHYESKRYKEAVEAFKQAIRLRPGEARTHYDLGLAYYNLNRYKEAAEAYERSVRLKPDWDEAHYRLGWAYYVLGKRKPSLEQHRILQKLNPELANILHRILKVETPAASKEKVVSRPDGDDRVEAVSLSAVPQNSDAQKPPTPAPGGKPDTSFAVLIANVVSTVNDAPQQPGTASTADIAPAKNDSEPAAAKETPAAATNGEASLTRTYRVGVGDVLDIRVLNTTTKGSSLFTVTAGGLLEYPLAGAPLVVGGMTTEEIAARLTSELRRRAVSENPQVMVSVRDYVSHIVIVNGLVHNTGSRILRREAVPLYVVLAEAQTRPEAGRATITRASGESLTVNLADPAAMNALIYPGDVIAVSERVQQFYYIGGQINSAGQKSFQPGLTLMQAILSAGGVSRPGNNVVELSREGADKRLTTTKYVLKEIKSGKVPDPRLQPGDLIEILQ